MRVSQRVDYALRVLTALAQRPPSRPAVAGDLAVSLGLPKRFVEQQVTALARAGLVSCRRGAGGGCLLARDARDVTVGDVVRAVEGDVMDVPHVTASATSAMWAGAEEALAGYLDAVTLGELAERQRELDASREPMYYI